MAPSKQAIPRVFISSTVGDLKPYREAAKDMALRAGFFPEMCEYWPSGNTPVVSECLDKVASCDLNIVIVAHCYGWVPDTRNTGEWKSITWMECEKTRSIGNEVLVFLLDPSVQWPEEDREEFRLVRAVREKGDVRRTTEKVERSLQALAEFRAWLDSLGIRSTFTTPDDLGQKVLQALMEWRRRHEDRFSITEPVGDPHKYMIIHREECKWIDIRGLQVGSNKLNRFPIEDLYIPLAIPSGAGREGKTESGPDLQRAAEKTTLEEALKNDRLMILGEPGSGKTTFLRRIVFALSESLLKTDENAAKKRIGIDPAVLPILVSYGDLVSHIRECRKQNRYCPTQDDDPAWLFHYLSERSKGDDWGLPDSHFKAALDRGEAILLLDGLDEAPDLKSREQATRLTARLASRYSKSRIVVTSRTTAYTETVSLADFTTVSIEPLDMGAIGVFLEKWTGAVHPGSPESAERHREELMGAIRSRPEIRRLTRNPVMLTALAVVHWNDKRLPEQRAELYESIIGWLLKARENMEGRLPPEKCGAVLQKLALAMQTPKKGRVVALGRRPAAEAIELMFPGSAKEERIAEAERFLGLEEVNSGIITGRSNGLAFWHLTFQEYLAARGLGGLTEENQRKLVFTGETLFKPEWREVFLLFGGVLYKQGEEKLDAFFKRVLDHSYKKRDLPLMARSAGLIGSMLWDLSPYGYKIKDPRYELIMTAVMAIFKKGVAAKKPLRARLDVADALGQSGDTRLAGDLMVSMPGGRFHRGAQKRDENGLNFDPKADADEGPVREIELSDFEIGRYPVTVQEYGRFVNDEGYAKEEHWGAGGFGKFIEPGNWTDQRQYPNRPVVGVSWFEAMAYADWAKCVLPTEAQWERAARGPGRKYRKFPWGNKKPGKYMLNWAQCGLRMATPVGMFPDSDTEEGVADLAGNVLEWCRDAFDKNFYTKSPSKDPVNADYSVGVRVLRGGSWDYDFPDVFRCAFRLGIEPINRVIIIGFRVARSR